MKEYVATFKTAQQISPDDFDITNPSLKVNEETTVKEIEKFFRKYCGTAPVEVKLIELQTNQP